MMRLLREIKRIQESIKRGVKLRRFRRFASCGVSLIMFVRIAFVNKD